MESHGGDLTSEYVMGVGEVNVDGEKTKEKSCPILATGGTCELMGKDMSGAACDNDTMRARTAQVARCEVIFIFGGSTHSLCQGQKAK